MFIQAMILSFCLSVMANLLIFMVYSFWQELVCWSVGDPVHKCHYILYQTNTVQSETVSVEDTSYSCMYQMMLIGMHLLSSDDFLLRGSVIVLLLCSEADNSWQNKTLQIRSVFVYFLQPQPVVHEHFCQHLR